MDDKPKKYKMLKTIDGSKDGITVETFTKDEIRDDIGTDLAEQFRHQNAIAEVGANTKTNPAEARETKVTGPAETKEEGEAGVPLETQRIEELNSVARDHLGLDTDTTMAPGEVREAIEGATEGDDPELPASDAEPLATKGKRKK